MLYYRNSHPHGSHYNPIMQQPALLAGHVTLPSNQTLNVGVAHVMRQPSTNNNNSSKKNKQHQMSARYSNTLDLVEVIIVAATEHSKKVMMAFHLEVFDHHHLCVLPSSLSFYKEYVSLRGVIFSGGAVTAALQAGEGEHAPTLRCATERPSFQLPAPAELWWQRVGG